jgi:hypothetical protein
MDRSMKTLSTSQGATPREKLLAVSYQLSAKHHTPRLTDASVICTLSSLVKEQAVCRSLHNGKVGRSRTSPADRRQLKADSADTSAAGAGGGDRDRTDDLLLAKQALSQLSYTPGEAVSYQLSAFRSSEWWAREDLNLRPHAYQARALTN